MVPASDIPEAQTWLRKFGFNWDLLDVVICGQSIIDSRGGVGSGISNLEDADRFCQTYGFDFNDPIQRAEAHGHFQESIAFIRKYFLQPENPDGLRLEIPKKILELTDVRELLLLSVKPSTDLRDWACALLKVMHSIAHIDKDVRTFYFTDIQKQILDRFYRIVHREEGDGALYVAHLGKDDPLRVNLVHFESKPKKSRESVILKLLHKAENVADEIFDRVGLRFVTESRIDVLRLLKFLKEHQIIMTANTKPSRARNTLIDVDHFRTQEALIFEKVRNGEMASEAQLAAALNQAIRQPQTVSENPHSSQTYRAIQFTCRQLIRIESPLHDQLKTLKAEARKLGSFESEAPMADGFAHVMALIDKTDLKFLPRIMSFFYPFEVQITDRAGYEESLKGQSAHSEYKRSQVQSAMKRVMRAFIDVSR